MNQPHNLKVCIIMSDYFLFIVSIELAPMVHKRKLAHRNEDSNITDSPVKKKKSVNHAYAQSHLAEEIQEAPGIYTRLLHVIITDVIIEKLDMNSVEQANVYSDHSPLYNEGK